MLLRPWGAILSEVGYQLNFSRQILEGTSATLTDGEGSQYDYESRSNIGSFAVKVKDEPEVSLQDAVYRSCCEEVNNVRAKHEGNVQLLSHGQKGSA